MLKKVLYVILSFVLILSLAGCGANSNLLSIAFDEDISSQAPTSPLIAQNENYKLELDERNYGIILTDLKTGKEWRSTPPVEGDALDEFGMPVTNHIQVESMLVVGYIDGQSSNYSVAPCYTSSVTGGRVRASGTDNGFIVEYYFDDGKFMIPVEFILLNDSVQIKIDPTKIQENKSRIISISIAPFLCSAKNNSEDSYLFFPSGSGALIEPRDISLQGIKYASSIYGDDLSVKETTDIKKGQEVRLPVFGAKSDVTTAICGIIEEGEESSTIETVVGSTAFKHSAVYANFVLRSYFIFTGKTGSDVAKDVYSQYMLSSPISIKYYPLVDEKANYTGMAETYKKHLIEKGLMPALTDDTNLNLTLVGGELVPKSFLGVPYTEVFAATTLKDAYNIVDEISTSTNAKPSVNLKGFTNSGIDISTVGGGFSIAESLGNTTDLAKLSELCKSKSAGLYFDFEINKFSSSTKDFKTFRDGAFNAGDVNVLAYDYNIATNEYEKSTAYHLLTPAKFAYASKQVVNKTSKWALDGLSLGSLSSISYSDFSDDTSSDYYAKGYYGDRVSDAYKIIKDSGKKVMTSDSNLVAALASNLIINAPLNSSKANIFSEDIPFYSMVFKGYVGLAGESVNLAPSPRRALLQSVEAGCGLNYTVINNWENSLLTCYSPIFYNSKYADIKDTIINNQNELSDYYKEIAGAKISSHNILADGVRETVFSNGVSVIVNYNKTAVTTDAGKVAAEGFIVRGAAK